MDVLVVGAGSLGSLLGGLLAREHEVTLVGREPHVGAIEEDGLAIEGEIDDRVYPAATTDLGEPVAAPSDAAAPGDASADLALVTVKAYDTDGAAATLADCDVDAVWSLQNGLGNEATLAEALDAPVLAGTATYGADRADPGAVRCTGLGEVAIGPRPGTTTPEDDVALAEQVGAALSVSAAESSPNWNVVVDPAMPERLWRKLAVNLGINPLTALARVENGALADGELRVTARAAARETARVATATGIELDDAEATAALDAVVDATAANRSSMRQDVEAGRRTEIDAIAGPVIDRADRHDVSVSTTRTLARIVRGWECGRGLR